jgi:hypothetical protein
MIELILVQAVHSGGFCTVFLGTLCTDGLMMYSVLRSAGAMSPELSLYASTDQVIPAWPGHQIVRQDPRH